MYIAGCHRGLILFAMSCDFGTPTELCTGASPFLITLMTSLMITVVNYDYLQTTV